jgi:hypothetical protein
MATPRETVAAAQQHDFSIEGFGTFTLRRQNFNDFLAIGNAYTKLVDGKTPADPVVEGLARIRATIDVTALHKPDGFSWDDVYDAGPFFAFYSQYLEWLDSFRNQGTATAGN